MPHAAVLWILDGDKEDSGKVRPDDKKWMSLDDLEVDRDDTQRETVRKMHNVGALAVDPDSPVCVYCRTGHAYHAGDSFPGVGLFQSKDGGKNWKLLAVAEDQIPTRISSIAVEPAARVREGPRSHIACVEVYVSEEDDGSHPRGRARPGMYHLWGSLTAATYGRGIWHLKLDELEKLTGTATANAGDTATGHASAEKPAHPAGVDPQSSAQR